ncbi:MAG: Lrp/AsnC family transcriptional regulator [Candidatus Micrarchaeota archaeon]
MQPYALDKKDKRILHELDLNGRAPLAQIAKKVGLSRQTIKYRFDNLVKRGIIWGFHTFIDYSRLGYYNYDVWIQLRDIPRKKKDAFIKYLNRHKNLLWLSECVGRWDMCAALLARNIGHFYALFDTALEKHPGVVRDYHISFSVSGSWYSRPYLLKESESPVLLWTWKSDFEFVRTDRTDKRILGLLAENARIPAQDISKKLKIDTATVGRRIKRLEKRKVIQGYRGMSEGQMSNLSRYEILVRLRGMTPRKEKALEEFCKANPYIYLYIKCVGRWDADIVTEVKSATHLKSMLSELRETFPESIIDYDALPITKEYRLNFFPGTLL